MKFRSDIEGLRALAVLLVLLVHAFPKSLPNGFIGVDIFFVISGYLITGILLREIREQQFSVLDFYIRRINRIFPALALVLAFSIGLGLLTLYPNELTSLGRSIAAGAGFIANLNFYAEAGYWDTASKLKPLLHLWSLGVEEQFYLIWPLALWIAWRRKWTFTIVCAGLLAVSLIANLVVTPIEQAAAFYLPFTRFWELLAGGWLACRMNNAAGDQRNRLGTPLGIVGAGLIAASLAIPMPPEKFPGAYAIGPVLGTVLLIAAGQQALVNCTLLSNRITAYFGAISYPLYLWHWPLLVFARLADNGTLTSRSRNLAVLASIVLASATYHLVENPIRHGRWRRGATAAVLLALVVALGTGGLGLYLHFGKQLQKTHNQPLETYARPEVTLTRKVALLGDSNAGHFSYGLSLLYGDRLVTIASPGWPYLAGTDFRQDYVRHPDHTGTPALTEEALSRLSGDPEIDVVIISNAFTLYFQSDSLRSTASTIPGETAAQAYSAGLKRTTQRLVAAGKRVVFVKAVPTFKVASTFACEVTPPPLRNQHADQCSRPLAEVRAERDEFNRVVAEALSGITHVAVFDTVDELCDADACHIIRDGNVMYADPGHFSTAGSQLMGAALARAVEALRQRED